MIYRLIHKTVFEYSSPVTFVYNTLHLKPRPLPWQTVLSSRLTVLPEPATLSEHIDYFGNVATFCAVEDKHDQMQVLIESEVEVRPRPNRSRAGMPWNEVLPKLQHSTVEPDLDAFQFCFDSSIVKRCKEALEYAEKSCATGHSAHDVAVDLMNRIHTEFTFDPVATNVSTPVEEVLRSKRGVCQDFAHLMICCLRSIGLPARYNSGYIQTAPPPGKPRLQGADASHAWVGVYCPANGWLDLDPTNKKPADEQFITIGWGRDYKDISPVSGVMLGGGKHTVHAQVDMIPETEFLQSQQQQQQ